MVQLQPSAGSGQASCTVSMGQLPGAPIYCIPCHIHPLSTLPGLVPLQFIFELGNQQGKGTGGLRYDGEQL